MTTTVRIRRQWQLGGIVLAAAGGLIGCGEPEPTPEPPLRPVRSEVVFLSGGERVRSFSGVARAGTESRLSFKVAGTAERVAVEVGDAVEAGALIAALDDTDYRLQEQQAEQSLRMAEAEARNAAANYERVRQLYENNNASLGELDAADATAAATRASVGAARNALQLARQQLSYTTLRAPVQGSIASVDVEVNENLRAGQVVVMLTSGARAEVEVGVPEVLIGQIAEGSSVAVRFDALPDETFTATVSEVGVTSAGMETTFPVTALLDREDARVRPGMAATADFTFVASGPEAFLVPLVAVAEDGDGRFVYVVTAAGAGLGTVARRDVEVGELVGSKIEVLRGLRDGDRVVTAGVSRIHAGLTVKVPEFGR